MLPVPSAPKLLAVDATCEPLHELIVVLCPLMCAPIQGCLGPIRFIIPEGTILRPSDSAAVVGGNVLTSQRVVDVGCVCGFIAV